MNEVYNSTKKGAEIDDGVRPYKVLSFLATWEELPLITYPLENTLGIVPTYSKIATGIFEINSDLPVFSFTKTACFITQGISSIVGFITWQVQGNTKIQVQTRNNAGNLSSGIISAKTVFEIRVYP